MKTKEYTQGGIRLSLISLFLVLVLCSTGIGIVGAEPVMSIIPSTTSVDVGDNFSVFIEVDPAGYTLQKANTNLTFDSSKVSILEVVDGGMFEFIFIGGTIGDGIIDDIVGVSTVGVSSTGNLAEIRMHADNPGTFTIGLSDAEVGNATAAMTPDINNGTVTVSVLTTITVSPASANLTVGEVQLFTATAYDQYGEPMAGVDLTWATQPSGIGTVNPTSATTDADGNATTTFTAVAEGTTNAGAYNGTVYGVAAVTVTLNNMTVTATTATPPNVTVNTPTSVVFNVTSDGSAVEGALVTLSGCGVDTNGTTGADGTVTIEVTATSIGTINVTATKSGYVTAETTVTVSEAVCPGDFTDDGYVNADDVVYLVVNLWGPCTPGAEGDFTDDGYVNADDVVYLVVNLWGPCP